MSNRIVFIDSHIANYQTLIAQLPHNTEAVFLHVEQHGIEQILAALQGKTNLSAIDIITHGSPGSITLGSGVLNNSNIDEYAEQLAQIGQHLTEDGDILLYGCEVAKGQTGQAFIERLAQLTCANVAASTNLTGAAELNADWRLQAHLGTIQAEALQFAYDGVLAIIDGTTGNDTLTGTSGDDLFTGDAGNDLLIGGGGNDVARFLGNHDEYQISTDEIGKITIRDVNATNGDEGTDTLDDAMVVRFADGDYAANVISRGGEFRINAATAVNQDNTAITALADGGFVVTWRSYNEGFNDFNTYAQRYGADGTVQGGEFQVNTTMTDIEDSADITALADGGFVVSWTAFNQDFSDFNIYAQRYNADGMMQGGEFRVNTDTADSNQSLSATTALADGGFVVSWQSFNQDGAFSFGIYAQRYDAEGIALGGEFRANTTTANSQTAPAISALADGGFVVSWESYNQDGSDNGIYAQRYNADGTVQGGEFRVNTTTANAQMSPATTALADGGFVVSWESYDQDFSFPDIYAQRYNADGTAQGEEFRVNTTTADYQWLHAISALKDGGFVVSWESYDQDFSSPDIYAQRYNVDGTPQGGEFRVNTTTANFEIDPAITALADGGFLMSWSSEDQDFSDSDIYAQRYDANGNPVQSVVQLSPLNTGTNQAPVLNTALANQAIKFGNALNYNAGTSFSDPDGDTLSFSATLANGGPLPAWMQINAGTGVISGTPNVGDRGTYSLTVKAADTHGLDITAPVTVAVTSFDAGKLLVSTSGNDILAGTASNDTVTYAYATAPVNVSLAIATQQNTVGAGRDTLTAIDNLIGGDFNDNLTGNGRINALEGGAGNDRLNGAGGADAMFGGLGNDTFVVNNAGDVVTEFLNEGTDRVNSNITYTLPANVENLTLIGTTAINGTGNGLANVITGNNAANRLNGRGGNDTLNGRGGNDTLSGEGDNDRLIGGTGNDVLDGGTGTNILTGGTGRDLFKFTTPGHIDSITDFSVVNDTIQLENAVFTALTTRGTLAAGRFKVGTQAQDNNDFVIYNNETGALLYDADGNGAAAATQIATLSGGLTLTNADIVVI